MAAAPLSLDLQDEISALNCIYGDEGDSSLCLTGPLPPPSASTSRVLLTSSSPSSPRTNPSAGNDAHIFLLHPPDLPQPITFKIAIPHSYPSGGTPPQVLSLTVEGRSSNNRQQRRRSSSKQAADDDDEGRWLSLSRDVMRQTYETNGGEAVCLYEFVEGMKEILPAAAAAGNSDPYDSDPPDDNLDHDVQEGSPPIAHPVAIDRGWVLSEPVTEKKSVFVARACRVESPADAKRWVEELVAGDKRLARATHNMYAYRIASTTNPGMMYQDNDDDGETAAGARLSHLLAIMDVSNVVVVVSRWYGGVKLGGDRFRIIGAVGRDAVVRLLGEGMGGSGSGSGDAGGGKEGKKGGKRWKR